MQAKGQCHCGAVGFEVRLPGEVVVQRCNCSICRMSGYQHLIVPAAAFRLLSGKGDLKEYRFNTGTARHLFCRHCSIKSFYVPRSNPDGYSINLNCLELPADVTVTLESFDGKNWEQHAGSLRRLSQKGS